MTTTRVMASDCWVRGNKSLVTCVVMAIKIESIVEITAANLCKSLLLYVTLNKPAVVGTLSSYQLRPIY